VVHDASFTVRHSRLCVAWRTPLALVLALLAMTTASAAQTERDPAEDERLAPLRLVQRVSVLVEDLTPDAERAALTREAVQSEAIARLRAARLRVNEEAPFAPFLYFQISVLCDAADTCALDVSSSVIQDVYLLQSTSRSSKARTWATGRLALAPRALVARRVREVVREQTDLFAADVLSARQRFASPVSRAEPTSPDMRSEAGK
jgi:hypothetical protein